MNAGRIVLDDNFWHRVILIMKYSWTKQYVAGFSSCPVSCVMSREFIQKNPSGVHEFNDNKIMTGVHEFNDNEITTKSLFGTWLYSCSIFRGFVVQSCHALLAACLGGGGGGLGYLHNCYAILCLSLIHI